MYENKLQIAFNVKISAIISKILRVIHTVAGFFNNIITFSMLDDIVFFLLIKSIEKTWQATELMFGRFMFTKIMFPWL